MIKSDQLTILIFEHRWCMQEDFRAQMVQMGRILEHRWCKWRGFQSTDGEMGRILEHRWCMQEDFRAQLVQMGRILEHRWCMYEDFRAQMVQMGRIFRAQMVHVGRFQSTDGACGRTLDRVRWLPFKTFLDKIQKFRELVSIISLFGFNLFVIS